MGLCLRQLILLLINTLSAPLHQLPYSINYHSICAMYHVHLLLAKEMKKQNSKLLVDLKVHMN